MGKFIPEDRAELIYNLRQTALFNDIIGIEAGKAADEIERLVKHNKDLEKTVRNLQKDTTMTKTKMLIVMRLDDMTRVHPMQVNGKCSKCKKVVGIYPSGQRVLAADQNIEIVCIVCANENLSLEDSALAPGAEFEPFESKPKTTN